MTTDPISSPGDDDAVESADSSQPVGPDEGTAPATTEPPTSPAALDPGFTRASAAWVATGVALLLLILLIIFVAQNTTNVEVQFLGWTGSISLGLALLIAAVGGGALVAIAGVIRVTQLRLHARRARRELAGP